LWALPGQIARGRSPDKSGRFKSGQSPMKDLSVLTLQYFGFAMISPSQPLAKDDDEAVQPNPGG